MCLVGITDLIKKGLRRFSLLVYGVKNSLDVGITDLIKKGLRQIAAATVR